MCRKVGVCLRTRADEDDRFTMQYVCDGSYSKGKALKRGKVREGEPVNCSEGPR